MTREWIPIWNVLRFPVTSLKRKKEGKKKKQKAQIKHKTHHHQTKHLGKKTPNRHTDHTQITALVQVGSNLMNKNPQAQGACTKSVFCRDAGDPAQSLSFSFPAAPLDSHCHGPGLLPEAHRTCTHGPRGSSTASAGQRLHGNKHVQHKLEGTLCLYRRKQIGPEDVKMGACWSSKDHLRSTTVLSFAAPLPEPEALQWVEYSLLSSWNHALWECS